MLINASTADQIPSDDHFLLAYATKKKKIGQWIDFFKKQTVHFHLFLLLTGKEIKLYRAGALNVFK